MAAFANLVISVLRLLGKQNVKRAMSNFKMRPHTAEGGVWSAATPREAPRPDRRQLARSRTAVGGRGAPAGGNRPAEPSRLSPEPDPRPRSGTPQPLPTGTAVGNGGQETRSQARPRLAIPNIEFVWRGRWIKRS